MEDRYLIFSDIHIHNHSNDWRRVDDALEVLDWILEESLKNEIKTVFFLGDFFHVRGYMYPSIVSKAYKKLLRFKEEKIDMHMLVGNHDMPFRHITKHNSLTAFNSIFPIIEQPMVFQGSEWDFYYLPYIEEQEHLEWAIEKIYDESKVSKEHKTVLLAHLDIYNALFHNSGTRSVTGVAPKFLSDKFDLVITGHYHTHQRILENIWYVGSPYQQNFSEANQKKGIMLFDNGSLTFIENKFSPKFLYINPDEVDERIENNYIKIFADKNDNIAALREKALKFNPRNVSISIGGSKQITDEKLINLKSSAKDVKLLLKEWVDKNANEDLYDKDRLIKSGYQIVERAISDFQ